MISRSLKIVTDEKIVVVDVGEVFVRSRPVTSNESRPPVVENAMTMYKLPPNGAYVGLQYPGVLYFRGILRIKVICGAVNIFGYKIKAGDKEVTLFSLKDSAALFIASENSDITNPIIPGADDSYYPKGYLMDRFKAIGKKGAIFELTNVRKQFKTWEHRLKQNGLNIFPDIATEPGTPLFPEVEKILESTFDHETGDRIDRKLEIPEVLKVVAESFNQKEIQDQVVLLTGGLGVGKSTVLRYLVNRSLQRPKRQADNNKVLVVDLDPGQSEFTMSGCISVVLVEAPLLGSNYSHLIQPLRCHYIGSCNVMECFTIYLESLQKLGAFLCNVARIRFVGTPVIINTMGLTNDIGFDILANAINYFKPSDIIEILSKNPNVNFKREFTLANLKKAICPYNPLRVWLPYFLHNKIPSCVPKGNLNAEKALTPKNKRDLVTLMYLRQDLECKGKPLVERICVRNNLMSLNLKVPVVSALCITNDRRGPITVGFGLVEGITEPTNEYLKIVSPVTHTDFCSIREVMPTKLSLCENSLREIINEALGDIPHTVLIPDGRIRLETDFNLPRLF